MATSSYYVGIDLGTTNSAAAVFDGEQAVPVQNAYGTTLTPSVVHLNTTGTPTVGIAAQTLLDHDPQNTHSEFKRLMGTAQTLKFAASGLRKRPEELAAEVLKSLRADIHKQFGLTVRKAVISVPALFELPQNSATSEAARLAGFDYVELLQEPIASAIAAGWNAESASSTFTGSWLVYDLGGGTFDVSLLETRDGLLRVVGHDGDNFLGGRDFDWLMVDWALTEIQKAKGPVLARANFQHAEPLRRLKLACEAAKIHLSSHPQATIAIADWTTHQSKPYDLELTIHRETLEQLCRPNVHRSLAICERLLKAHGIDAHELAQIVLVGGPSLMPLIRQQIHEKLGIEPITGLDPMTLVAHGAAIYAATAGLEACPQTSQPSREQPQIWLQYPAMTSDLNPHVVGRLVERTSSQVPAEIRLCRGDDLWQSPWATIDQEGAFILSTSLVPRKPNIFRLEGRYPLGGSNIIPLHPATITIVQGLTISDPPLARSVGVALANDHVQTYFERGAPLPARRTFTLHTVESVTQGSDDCLLKIPIVQGEFDTAHLCRLIGSLEITGKTIQANLGAGAEVELSIELDRGGRLSARAFVPSLGQVFEQVAHLLVPEASPEVLQANVESTLARVSELRSRAFRESQIHVIDQLSNVEPALAQLEQEVHAALGGDLDAAQKARRAFIELDAKLEEVEMSTRWPELDQEAQEALISASGWIAEFGHPHEQRLLEELAKTIEQARKNKQLVELERQLRLLRRLSSTAFSRHPQAWYYRFESAASEMSNATDLVKAQALVDEGRAAAGKSDIATLRLVTQKLWQLLPADAESRRLGYNSGVRL